MLAVGLCAQQRAGELIRPVSQLIHCLLEQLVRDPVLVAALNGEEGGASQHLADEGGSGALRGGDEVRLIP